MGSDRSIRAGLALRCCQGVSFGFGFIVTIVTLAIMFWIAWCYFGLTIIQLSDTQRRAIVSYSYTKPSPSPTSSPVRSTTVPPEETSINSISKSATTATVLRGVSRGESPNTDKKKETLPGTSTMAKGDFSSRDRATHSSSVVGKKDTSGPSISSPRGPPKDGTHSDPGRKADILSGSSEESYEDSIYVRRVSSPGAVNRPDKALDDGTISHSPTNKEPRSDISPSKVYTEVQNGSSKGSKGPEADRSFREDDKTQPHDYIERDKSVPSRRDDSPKSDTDPVYREPNFDREYPRRYASDTDRDRGRSRYDDIEDDRRIRIRYDKRDRGRENDDRYSKGDTRVYPESRPTSDDRYRDRVRERYPEDSRRRGDDDDRFDDRYRDYEERPRYYDREPDRRDRDRVGRLPVEDEKYRDDDRYRSRSEEKYRSRDGDAYRYRDDERYRYRNDERYKSYGDDRNRSLNEDRFRDRGDNRDRTRDGDRYRDDDEYRRDPLDRRDSRYRDEDRYRSRTDGERYINASRTRDENYRRPVSRNREDFLDDDRRYKNERDRYRTRNGDRYDDIAPSRSRDVDIRDSTSRSTSYLPPRDRKLSSSRAGYDERNIETVSDYDVEIRDRTRSYVRDDIEPIRKSRPDSEERIISRYDEDEKRISPTRTRVEDSLSRSSLSDLRPKEPIDDTRYTNNAKDRRNEDSDRYDREDRIRNTKFQGSRESTSARDSSRRLSHDRDEYRTRLPDERIEKDKVIERREEVLDRRSYISEEDDEYKRKEARRDYEYDERDRRPIDDSRRRFIDDDRYRERDRIDDEEYRRGRPRTNYDGGNTRSRDRYVDETRRYDDRYYQDDRFISKDDRSPPLPVRKSDTYPDDSERSRRRDSNIRKEHSLDRIDGSRSSTSSKNEDRYYSRDEYSGSESRSRRRNDDDLSFSDSSDDFSEKRRRTDASKQQASRKESNIRSSVTPVRSSDRSDIVIREKRFHNTETRPQNSRVSSIDDTKKDRRYLDSGSEPKSSEEVRPLSAKDVIEAAIRHSDNSDKNARKVYYPVFDPRISNLTSSELIRQSERRGTTITAKRRRSI